MLSRMQILALGFLPGITSSALRALAESGASFDEIVAAPRADLAMMGLRRAALDAMDADQFRVFFDDAVKLIAEQLGFDPLAFMEGGRAAA